MDINTKDSFRILDTKDLGELLPFGKTKLFKLLYTGKLPVVKIGADYITTSKQIEKWIENNNKYFS